MRLDFYKYVMQLFVDSTETVDNLSGAIGISEDFVNNNLQLKIKKKFFTNAYIDEQANELVLSSMSEKV